MNKDYIDGYNQAIQDGIDACSEKYDILNEQYNRMAGKPRKPWEGDGLPTRLNIYSECREMLRKLLKQ